jgi:hypothetical protein
MVSSKGRTWLYVGITSFKGEIGLTFLFLLLALPAFAAGGTCPSGANYLNTATNTLVTLSSLGITSCYFVAANGSDSNDGLSEASGHPWLHAPMMPNCSGTCATVQATLSIHAAAGLGFIFRGGDTWHYGASTSPSVGGTWEFNASPYPFGTASNPIYLGVDQTWHTGGSWARPIMNADNPLCNGNTLGSNCFSGTDSLGQTYYYVNTCAYQISSSNNMVDVSGSAYYIIDNFEMTGLCLSAPGQVQGDSTYIRYGSVCNQLCSGGVPLILTNNYIHGASHLKYAAWNGQPGCTGAVCFNLWAFQGSVINVSVGETIQNNVVDFADSDPTGEGLCFGGFYNVAYNVFRYTTQCVANPLHLFHDNLYEYFFENGHSNLLEDVGESTGANAVYNNVFRHVEAQITSGGGAFLWLAPPTSTTTDYIFNNLAYDVGNLEYLNIGGTAGNNAQGNYKFFNNTWQSNNAQPILRCDTYKNGAVTDTNNHYIDNQNYILGPCSTLTTTTALAQTNAQGVANVSTHFDQYTASQTYGYSPVASKNSTVGAGTNVYSSMCGALGTAGLTAAQTACESKTTYACSYAGNGAAPVCPAGAVNARPSSAAWDVGAYEFNAQDPSPNPPTGLSAVVH